MLRKLRPRSIYDVMAAIGCIAALTTGTAYAANTVFSTDIVDGQVKSVDIGDTEVGSADVKDNSINTFDVHSFLGVDVVDGSLTSADVAPGTFVAGRGQLLSNRIVFTPSASNRLLLAIPGLGDLVADCGATRGFVFWANSTTGPVDIWFESTLAGRSDGRVMPASSTADLVSSFEDQDGSMTVSLGVGNDPGPRRVATIRVSALQSQDGAPCGFQAQGTLWTSP